MEKNKQTRANQSKNMQTSQERVKTKVKTCFFGKTKKNHTKYKTFPSQDFEI